MRTGYEKHTLSNAAIWYGLTTSCISISKLNNMGHVQLCHLSFHFNLFATVCNVKLKIYTCNCHFLQALTPPQVMIINMKVIITICFSKDTYSILWTFQFLLLIYVLLILSTMFVSLFSSCSQ
ncbi:hypothetical protein PAMP_012963 [Pampus punctatissimus]